MLKRIMWYVLTFISCLFVGLLTRGLSRQIPFYGFHATLAALPISFLLVLCFWKTADKPVWIQIIPILLFGLFLGMMSPVMAFYNIGAALLAAALTYIVKLNKATVLAFGYAFLSYPLAVLGGKLFGKTAFAMAPFECLILIAATALLSFLGTAIGAHFAGREQRK